ncbi:MAG: hypothetical protein WBA12_04925 [Catalinimonas sp.]
MTFYYFLVCAISIILFTWIIIRLLKQTKFPPNNDDNGGSADDANLPIIDLPPGSHVDDLLIDRLPEDFSPLPHVPRPTGLTV